MKKFLLSFVVAVFSLASCADYTDDFNTINNRLDALEQSVPSIEEQIESINAQLTSLKATDEAIKEQIDELEKSDKATATEIADLKKKDSALEKSINDLQNYVDIQIANAKSEAAAAYATVEQYNAIVAQLGALQSSTDKLGEELTAKINAEVKSLTDKIADLEARLKAVEDKVENLLARIQSVSYIPTYNDNKATLKYISGASQVVLDFKVSPKECVAELEKVWESAVKVDAVYTETRAVSFVDMPIVKFEADAENGVISVIASGENLSEGLFAGTQSASAALIISDGNSSVTSEYVPMVAQEVDMYQLSVPANQIWYTSTNKEIVAPLHPNNLGANIISNTYYGELGIIIFEKNVSSIGEKVFQYCDKLQSIILPDSVTSIGYCAFSDCTSLTSITIPDSVTSIGGYAFSDCTSLTSVTIPDSVTSIGNSAFNWSKNLSNVYYQGDLSDWCKISFDGWNANPLYYGAKLYLNGSELTDMTIPSDITEIKEYAFCGCTSLTSVTIPENVIKIGRGAFEYCTGELIINSKIIETDYTSFSNPGGGNGWLNEMKFTKLTIGDNIAKLGDYVFCDCDSITELTIPATILSVGAEAFYNCNNIKRVYIDSMTSWLRLDFEDFRSTPLFCGAKLYFNNVEAPNEVTIPLEITEIKPFAFYGYQPTSVTFHNSITSIGDCAFFDCTSLTSITIPDSVTSIGRNAFEYCSSLTSVTISENVVKIGQCAFGSCLSLKEVYCKPITPPKGDNGMFGGTITIYVPASEDDTIINSYKTALFWKNYAKNFVEYDFTE